MIELAYPKIPVRNVFQLWDWLATKDMKAHLTEEPVKNTYSLNIADYAD
jgi:hypothetical protein